MNEPDIWENGRTVLDLQLGKSLLNNKLDIRISYRDALAQKLFFYQDINANGAFDLKSDDIIWASRFAPTISFSVSCRF